jgi:hypothetical protein
MPDLFSMAFSAEKTEEIGFPWAKVANLVALSESTRRRVTRTTPLYEPIFVNRVRDQGPPEVLKNVPRVQLNEHFGPLGMATEQDRKRTALNARKQAWFNGSGGAGPIAGEGAEPIKGSEAGLQCEIVNLRAELLKTRTERDLALAALGLPVTSE